MSKKQNVPMFNRPEKRNVFTSRGPRNPEEIGTCVAMLEDSPFWEAAHYTLSRSDIVKIWVDLISTGRGYIDIIENEACEPLLADYKRPGANTPYQHPFYAAFFVNYVTFEFAREIITGKDISDIHLHFLQSMIRHYRDKSMSSPAMTAEQLRRGRNRMPGHGLYSFIMHVQHPMTASRIMLASSPQGMDRLRRTPTQIAGGLMHHAWITNVATEFNKQVYAQVGNQLLREYPGNEAKSSEKKKYVFCLTNSRETSESLGVPGHIQANIDHEHYVGNWYQLFFDDRKPCAGLNEKEQHTCFLIMLGYTSAQIAQTLSTTVGSIGQYQNKAGKKLYEAGYHGVASGFTKDGESKHSRETISKVIFDNLHEVRSYLLPLYPWPEGVFLR